jgi:D-3-phosphoglycerate dehydrogenase
MYKVIITEELDRILEKKLSEKGFHCEYLPDITYEKLLTIIPNYEVLIIRSKFSIQKELIDISPKLKIIGRLGAGMENIDVKYAESKGISCINSPEGNRDAVGEHALGMILSLINNMLIADNEIRNGVWQRNSNRGTEIHGKTVGIIGYGNMGSAFAQRLLGFEANVIAYDKYKKDFSDKYVKEVDLIELFKETDILSFHVPLTDETHFMLDDEFIKKFEKPIYIINTARGKVIKTSDLVKNLKSGKIRGAALDVLEYEKIHFENIFDKNEDFEYLIKAKNVILTPHVAGRTFESEKKLVEFLADKIIKEAIFKKV